MGTWIGGGTGLGTVEHPEKTTDAAATSVRKFGCIGFTNRSALGLIDGQKNNI
jgi:hypothetical protein